MTDNYTKKEPVRGENLVADCESDWACWQATSPRCGKAASALRVRKDDAGYELLAKLPGMDVVAAVELRGRSAPPFAPDASNLHPADFSVTSPFSSSIAAPCAATAISDKRIACKNFFIYREPSFPNSSVPPVMTSLCEIFALCNSLPFRRTAPNLFLRVTLNFPFSTFNSISSACGSPRT